MPRRQYVTPECCATVRRHATVFLYYPFDRRELVLFAGKPIWGVRAWSEEYQMVATVPAGACPHCAKAVPDVVERPVVEPVCAVTDGGYRCATCGERLDVCDCLPPEARFRPKE